jgi:hypothetical protein
LEDLNMKSLKIASIALALAFAVGMGCGDDSTTSNPDAPVITGTGGTMGPDAGIPGTGGMMTPDAPLATGGTMTPDAPLGAGGMMAPDGAAVGTGGMAVDGPMGAGGMVQIDATMGTGGMGGGIDASMPGNWWKCIDGRRRGGRRGDQHLHRAERCCLRSGDSQCPGARHDQRADPACNEPAGVLCLQPVGPRSKETQRCTDVSTRRMPELPAGGQGQPPSPTRRHH